MARYETDYSLCIICQKAEGLLVEKPSTHEKVLQYVHDRASYGDGDYPEICKRFGNMTAQDLASKNASWHRKCYQDTVHTGKTMRAKERFQKQVAIRSATRPSSDGHSSATCTFTRSQSVPYEKELCFFCEHGAEYNNPVHKVATENAGRALKEAVEKSGNKKFHVKLCTAIDPKDAHAIDVRYHKRCWAIHVTHVLRRSDDSLMTKETKAVDEYAAEVEFISLVQGELLDGRIVSMAALQQAYTDIRAENNVVNPGYSRKSLKKILQREIPDIEFHRPKQVSEPERVSIKCVSDAAIQLAEDERQGDDMDMKCLFTAASILRKAISKSSPWTFSGSLTDVQHEHIPTQLYSFYRWVIQGPKATLSNEAKHTAVNKNAASLAQTTVSMFLSKHQVSRKKTQSMKAVRETPQQLAVGLAIRQATRSKKIVNFLHGLGMSIEYNRILRIESQLANSVLQRILQNDNIYIPPDVVQGRFIFFAVDNVDFAEDTPDGKHTLHGTAMAIYQRCQSGDKVAKLELCESTTQRSMNEMPSIPLLECSKPASQPPICANPTFCVAEDLAKDACIPDAVWLLGRTMLLTSGFVPHSSSEGQPEDHLNCEEVASPGNIPPWSGYNSLISKELQLTRVSAPPLLAAPAHEWQTLLTVLMQAQDINAKVVGRDRKTVISLDMALYK